MQDITLLVDYRGAFYSSTTNARALCSMNISRLVKRFAEFGVDVRVQTFSDVDFHQDWTNIVVLYQSSEDYYLNYKSYIEDIILGLTLAGARVLPAYPFLRAHHNKVFLEILQQVNGKSEVAPLSAATFGTVEEFMRRTIKYPVVMKSAAGAGSKSVRLVHNSKQAKKIAHALSWSGLNIDTLKELSKRLLRKGHLPYSLYRNKFITQQFITGLTHDYKVLIYGNRVFIVRREVRNHDFRASGSGLLSWPREIPDGLLNFAWNIFCGYDVPHASLDIAEEQSVFHLIEAQFVCFGPATLERSQHHWQFTPTGWEIINSCVELEKTFVDGIMQYTNTKDW